MHPLKSLALLTSTLTAIAGCDPEVALDAAGREVVVRSGNGGYGGVWLNTSAIGGQAFSEMDLGGALHDGVKVLGVEVKGPKDEWIKGDKTEVVDGTLRVKVGKTVYAGADLLGARWQLTLVDAEGVAVPRALWIVDMTTVSAKEVHYTFQTDDEQGEPMFMCEPDALGQHAAAVIKDVTIDPFTAEMAPRKSTAYFACTSGAVGKAITWGYRPWERKLAEFAAAVRVVRADYCADGMSWTEDGVALQLKDRWNINTFASAAAETEAVWTETGLACLTLPRVPEQVKVSCAGQVIPSCPAQLSMATYKDTQFWTKLAPQ